MNSIFHKDLNPAQLKAVQTTEGPNLILAGAGSGKTRLLTYKVAYLIIEKGIDPANILMLTFTNKAAGEMKERIRKLLSDQEIERSRNRAIALPFAGTFHAFCVRILRIHGEKIGIDKNFLIYDRGDSLEVIKEAINELNFNSKKINKRAVLANISQVKNQLISPSEYHKYAWGYLQEITTKIYSKYQKLLSSNKALDFDDLLFKTMLLFTKREDVLHNYQDKFKYILIDEYQDTNSAQYKIAKLIAKKRKSLTVVGDASQSIYSFRGADFTNIVNFKKDYPNCQVFHLEQNYRSTQTILDAAYSVISQNRSHPILTLWTKRNQAQTISIYQAINEHDEADFLTREISKLTLKSNALSSFAILYRTNAQSRVIEEAFLQQGLSYTLVGGVRFYQRKEVRDVLSYLRLFINLGESISYQRIEKLGKKKLKKFLDFIKDKQQKYLASYTTLEILDKILNYTNYLDRFNEKVEKDRSRIENIKELRSVAAESPNLLQFMEKVALVEQEYLPSGKAHLLDNNYQKTNGVTLMTIHAAKGLEFPIVFLVGMEEGLFPHSHTLSYPDQLEEERRLCYVGMTRAMHKLYLTYASKRFYFGHRISNKVSRFVEEIPEHLINKNYNYF